MEKGNLRCDVNVSIMPEGAAEFGTRTELKNLNSFVSIERSVLVESARQKEVLADGGEIRQETRLWDQDREITESMRGKEDSPDYRYFPEPDLPAVKICQADIDAQRDSLPEMPEVRLSRWLEDYGFPQLETVPLMVKTHS